MNVLADLCRVSPRRSVCLVDKTLNAIDLKALVQLVGRVVDREDLAEFIVHGFLAIVGAVSHSFSYIFEQLEGLLSQLQGPFDSCWVFLSCRIQPFEVNTSAKPV